MKKSKVLLRFVKFSIALKIEFFRNIIKKMKSNVATFATPDVPLTELTTLVDKLESDFNNSQDGARGAKADMRKSNLAANEGFKTQAAYVDRIAKGDEAIILSSGFESSKQPDPAIRPIFGAEAGENPGDVKLFCKAVSGAKSYAWQYCKDPLSADGSTFIYAGVSTQANFTVTDLTSLVKYWFRFAAVTSDGMQAWSDPIMKVAP
jgi:hypothetical protein